MVSRLSNFMLGAEPSTSTSSSSRDVLASCTLITKRMQAILDYNPGLLMLHRSKWRCLVSSYSAEIGRLNSVMSCLLWPWERLESVLRMPLQALVQAVQEGEACMQHYKIPKGNHHSWLMDKALKLAMSTDVVDVHLHHFLWVSSTVYHQISEQLSQTGCMEANDVIDRTIDLCKIWEQVDAKNDLRIAQALLIKLKSKREKCTETCQLVDFFLHKLSHVEAPQNLVTPDSLPPSYMCIDSDQCLHTNTESLFKNHSIEIRPVMWLGGRLALKSFQRMDCSNPAEMQKFLTGRQKSKPGCVIPMYYRLCAAQASPQVY